jgi:ATP synthase protein I
LLDRRNRCAGVGPFDGKALKKVSSTGFGFGGLELVPGDELGDGCPAGSFGSQAAPGQQSGQHHSRATSMANAVLLQATVTGIVAALAAVIGGWNAGLSALLGGLACVVPSGIFAWQLARDRKRPGGATMHVFFVGELTKLALTVLMLFVVARVYRDLNWLALVVGFIAVLKSYFWMFVFGRRR